MPYPFDGAPNLRPGAERFAHGLAPRFEPHLPLDELFEDFIAGSASIINDRTEKTYRYDVIFHRSGGSDIVVIVQADDAGNVTVVGRR